jgi:hypothetical protein
VAYLDALTALTHVTTDSNRVTLTPLGGAPRTLLPAGGARFRATTRHGITHVLLTSGNMPMITDGQRTLERVALPRLVLGWVSAIAGIVALVLLVGRAVWVALLAVRRGGIRAEPLAWIVPTVLCLVVAALLLVQQPFLAIGDPTAGNRMLTAASVLLPAGAGIALVQLVRTGGARRRWPDVALLVGVAQWCVVLWRHDVLPMMLWR